MSASVTEEIFNAQIKTPFSMIIAGPSNSGKTTYVHQLLLNSDRLIDHTFDYVLWFYGQKIPNNLEIKNINIQYIDGIPENIDNFINPEKNGLAIFDDLMEECENNKIIANFFTKRSHHENVSIIFITQNFFSHGKERKTFTKNATYFVIFNSPLDQTISHSLAHKIMPKQKKVFQDIFNEATKTPYSYLFIDGHQQTPKKAMLRSNMFNEVQNVYYPTK